MQTEPVDLFKAMSRGDHGAFERLFKTYYRELVRFAYDFVKDKDAAEDLVQEVFVKIWERKAQIQIQSSPRAYFYMAVKNHCLNKIKVEQRNAFLDDSYDNHIEVSHNHTEQLSDTIHLKQHINEALEKLPPRCGIIFKLSRFENKSYKEIAEVLDISVKTVENQIGKALHLMREQLHPYLNTWFVIIFLKNFFDGIGGG
ncbi:MAG: RNA polymerase sigma-70 factor [Bacteroidota bacterium]|jgi:RNA polymerase sigma-70 factor (ECF subfamily)